LVWRRAEKKDLPKRAAERTNQDEVYRSLRPRLSIWLTCVASGGLAAGAGAAGRVQAADAPRPVMAAPAQAAALPFSNAELEQALLARILPADGPAGRPIVRVEPAEPGSVNVRVGARNRVVPLAGRTGDGAARVVALVIAELLSAAPPLAGAAAPASVSAIPTPPGPVPAAASPPIAAAPPVPMAVPRLCVTGGVAKGTGGEELLAGTLDLDVIVPFARSRLQVAPSVGLMGMPTRNAGSLEEVSFSSAVARLLGGASVGPVDFLAGPLLSAYSIGGATPHAGWR
jgi:hypothetical protein